MTDLDTRIARLEHSAKVWRGASFASLALAGLAAWFVHRPSPHEIRLASASAEMTLTPEAVTVRAEGRVTTLTAAGLAVGNIGSGAASVLMNSSGVTVANDTGGAHYKLSTSASGLQIESPDGSLHFASNDVTAMDNARRWIAEMRVSPNAASVAARGANAEDGSAELIVDQNGPKASASQMGKKPAQLVPEMTQ